jgi:hypothetical protein
MFSQGTMSLQALSADVVLVIRAFEGEVAFVLFNRTTESASIELPQLPQPLFKLDQNGQKTADTLDQKITLGAQSIEAYVS